MHVTCILNSTIERINSDWIKETNFTRKATERSRFLEETDLKRFSLEGTESGRKEMNERLVKRISYIS